MRAILVCLCLLVLSGCLPKSKEWTHPRIASPRKEDAQFVEDTRFCQGKIGAQPEGPAKDAAMADCYGRLGWKRKE